MGGGGRRRVEDVLDTGHGLLWWLEPWGRVTGLLVVSRLPVVEVLRRPFTPSPGFGFQGS